MRLAEGLDEPLIRMSKVGRKLYVEVDFIVEPGSWDVSDKDRIRRAVIDGISFGTYEVRLNIELTTDPALIESRAGRSPDQLNQPDS